MAKRVRPRPMLAARAPRHGQQALGHLVGPQHGAGLDPVEAVVELRGLEVPEPHPGGDAEHLAPHRPRHRLAEEPLQLALDGSWRPP